MSIRSSRVQIKKLLIDQLSGVYRTTFISILSLCMIACVPPKTIFSPGSGTAFNTRSAAINVTGLALTKTLCYTTDGSAPVWNAGTCQGGTTKRLQGPIVLSRITLDCGSNTGARVLKKIKVRYDWSDRDDYTAEGDYYLNCDAQNNTSMPVFLLGGQSNMVGNVDQSLFQSLMIELNKTPTSTLQARLESALTNWYQNWNDGYAMYGYSKSIVAYEAAQLIRLKQANLVGANLTSAYSKVMCAMNESVVQALTTNCGSPFGPELVLGHVLGNSNLAPTSLIKIARGGSTLYTDWRSPSTVAKQGGVVGEDYKKLAARIKSLKSNPESIHPKCVSQACDWAAFVWFQGENDSFDQANAQAYGQHLRNFIADVRAATGSPTLPIIIVQVGAWAQSLDHGKTVAAAQQSFVAADTNARMVRTDDLSGFYHYDSAAQLIIGERVGLAVKSLVK